MVHFELIVLSSGGDAVMCLWQRLGRRDRSPSKCQNGMLRLLSNTRHLHPGGKGAKVERKNLTHNFRTDLGPPEKSTTSHLKPKRPELQPSGDGSCASLACEVRPAGEEASPAEVLASKREAAQIRKGLIPASGWGSSSIETSSLRLQLSCSPIRNALVLAPPRPLNRRPHSR